MSEFELSKFTPAPQPELICGICMGVLEAPYETPCRHVFCRHCIFRALRGKRKCPICRAPCTRKKCREVVPLVQQLINNLTMRCNNFQHGCTELIRKERFLDHIKTCSYAMVQCRHKGCGLKLLEKDRENHEQNVCPCRSGVCATGCDRAAPLENTSSDKCSEALVKVAPGGNQEDDDNSSSHSTIHDDNRSCHSTIHDDNSSSHSSIHDDNWSSHSSIHDNWSSHSSIHDNWSSHSSIHDNWSSHSTIHDDTWSSHSTIHDDTWSIHSTIHDDNSSFGFDNPYQFLPWRTWDTNIATGNEGSEVRDLVHICDLNRSSIIAGNNGFPCVFSYVSSGVGQQTPSLSSNVAQQSLSLFASAFFDDIIRGVQLFILLFICACCLCFAMFLGLLHKNRVSFS
ncbi:hypothetical protein BsWGS_25168 [Bradybaena similaris]